MNRPTEIEWHRSFFDQVKECLKTGNRFAIDYPNGIYNKTPMGLIACVPFKSYCHSKGCFEMRKNLPKKDSKNG